MSVVGGKSCARSAGSAGRADRGACPALPCASSPALEGATKGSRVAETEPLSDRCDRHTWLIQQTLGRLQTNTFANRPKGGTVLDQSPPQGTYAELQGTGDLID